MGDYEYLEKLKDFYNEKYYNSKVNCFQCDSSKKFIESEESLILSCGSDEKGKCGKQFVINLPIYQDLEKELYQIETELFNNLDWETIDNYTDTNGEKGKFLENKTIYYDFIKNYQEMKSKDLDKYKKKIEPLYNEYIKLKGDSKIIFNSLKNESLQKEEKKELRRSLIQKNKEIQNCYHEIIEFINDNNFNNLIQLKPGSVEIYDENYLNKSKKDRKDKKDKKDLEDEGKLIEIIIDHFKKNNGILKKKDYEKIKGNYKTKWGSRLFSSLRYLPGEKNKNPWMKKEQLEHGPIITETEKKSDKIKLTKNWMKFLNIQKKDKKDDEDKKNRKEIKQQEMKKLEDYEPEPAPEEPERNSEENQIHYYSRSKENKWLSTFNTLNPDTGEKLNPFKYDGIEYNSVENAFHAQKIDPNHPLQLDYKLRFSTSNEITPDQAKKMGSKKAFKIDGYTLRDDWNDVRLQIMEDITSEFLYSNREIQEKLIQTGNAKLIHYGPRIDEFWGQKKDGSGENHHGKILMKLREEFKNM